jgi:hypothetical protein
MHAPNKCILTLGTRKDIALVEHYKVHKRPLNSNKNDNWWYYGRNSKGENLFKP